MFSGSPLPPPARDQVHEAPADALPPAILYGILRLRSAVFVVEQQCAYLDLDGRDLEESALQLWIQRRGEVIATLRLLWDAPRSARIGRVATSPAARSGGLGALLMLRALELARAGRARTVALDAQSRLEPCYERFGFARSGPNYVEYGIEHVPMTRTYPDEHDR